MFAKVFGQIFDSSIAEDYNCRRMFMDLLVLADSTGAVDMTPEAISRRTNVPQTEVEKYIKELCQPDARSRSDLHEGKRLIPLDDKRNWGWLIVNYQHYRAIKDEEARRAYFRTAQRDYRKKKKKAVKDEGLTKIDKNGQMLTPASASSSAWVEELQRDETYKGIDVKREYGKMCWWCKTRKTQPTQRRFINWLNRVDRPMSLDKPKVVAKSTLPVAPEFIEWALKLYPDKSEAIKTWKTWAEVPQPLRSEWWREGKSQLTDVLTG